MITYFFTSSLALDDINSLEETAFYPKRAGFVGMRGKKDDDAWEDADDEVIKRAPFQGMRGKKDPEWDAYGFYKRAPFQGMRGKKDTALPYSLYLHSLAKAAAAANQKRAGFVGMRGKKSYDDLEEDEDLMYPEEKRAAFMGMRGKKANSRLRASLNNFYPKIRRASSGFVGMRGR